MSQAKTYEFTVPAGGAFRLLAVGNYFRILTASGLLDVTGAGLDLQGVGAGDGLQGKQFDYLNFTDKSGGANAVKVVIASGEFLNAPQVSTAITTNKNPQSSGFSNTQKTVTTASGQLVAANSARQYLAVQNKSATGSIWLRFGTGGATQGNGLRIGPGGFWEWDSVVSVGEIQAIGDIASNTEVLVVEG